MILELFLSLFSTPSILLPSNREMSKLHERVKKFVPASTMNHLVACKIKFQCLTMHTSLPDLDSSYCFHLIFHQFPNTVSYKPKYIFFLLNSFPSTSIFSVNVWIFFSFYNIYLFNRYFLMFSCARICEKNRGKAWSLLSKWSSYLPSSLWVI